MRKSDIFLIIIVASVGTLAAFFLFNILLGNPDDKYVSFKTIETIEASVTQPDPDVFNVSAINPTVEVYVGNCEDIDQNGRLDKAELIACGRIDSSVEGDASEDTELNVEENSFVTNFGSMFGEDTFNTTDSVESINSDPSYYENDDSGGLEED